MKKNLGSADRLVRLLLGIVLGFLYFTNTLTGTLGIVALIVGIVLVLTSFVSFCPLYAMLGIRSNKNNAVKS